MGKECICLFGTYSSRRVSSNFDVLKDSFIVFLIFTCASASVYSVNDLFDRESDSLHPIKSSRFH